MKSKNIKPGSFVVFAAHVGTKYCTMQGALVNSANAAWYRAMDDNPKYRLISVYVNMSVKNPWDEMQLLISHSEIVSDPCKIPVSP